MGKYLATLGYRRLSVRPQHPKGDQGAPDPEALALKRWPFSKRVRRESSGRDPGGCPGKACRDMVSRVSRVSKQSGGPFSPANARVGQQGTLTRVWAKRCSRPRAPRDTRYEWPYLFGAVCPSRGTAAGLVLPFVNTDAMNAHLAEIARTVAPGAHAILVLDGAGWHSSKTLAVPDNISLLPLPPYSPELNPVENVWQYLRANWLAISVFDDYPAIVDACCLAWNRFADDPKTVTSITDRKWAQVNL